MADDSHRICRGDIPLEAGFGGPAAIASHELAISGFVTASQYFVAARSGVAQPGNSPANHAGEQTQNCQKETTFGRFCVCSRTEVIV
jgi:hypothetical protein